MINVDENTTEITAIISILSREHKDSSNLEDTKIHYSIELSFVGAIILPPYLPRIEESIESKKRVDILENLDKLAIMYEGCYSDWWLDEEEGKKIRSAIKEIGCGVADYFESFKEILQLLAKTNVKNIIFYTDDFAIPWSWAYYYLEDHLLRYPEFGNDDFLANRYSCGTLIVDSAKMALNRFKQFIDGYTKSATNEDLLRNLSVCLLQGSLRDKGRERALHEDYVNHLREILSRQFERKNIRIYTRKDWYVQTGDPERFVYEFLPYRVFKSKIVHFTGHIINGALKFDENTLVSPHHLSVAHLEFQQSPLVVLHGCSSGRIIDLEHTDGQLPTAFLDMGASGCLVALLPVDIPVVLDEAPETMIDIFYRGIMELKSYGQALLDARHEFQKNEKTKHNPQWLFFKLYGDPRAMLITTSRGATIKTIDFFAEEIYKRDETRRKTYETEGCVALAFNRNPTERAEFLEELEAEGFQELELVPASTTLGVEALAEIFWSPEAIEIYRFIGNTVAGAVVGGVAERVLNRILKKKKKTLKKAKAQEIKSLYDQRKTNQLIDIGYYEKPYSTNFTWVTFEIIPLEPYAKN